MSYPNPLYDPSRRRRASRHRLHNPGAPHRSPLARLATAAAVAYGAYRLGSWAWRAYFGEDDGGEEDPLYEWDGDRLSFREVRRDVRREEGFSPLESEEEDETEEGSPPRSDHLKRSRRSRVDWSDSHERSESPSPAMGYRHHSPAGGKKKGGEKDAGGLVKMGMADLVGSAISAGITMGIESYNNKSRPGAESSLDQERQLRIGRCRLETSRAMVDFLPTLKKAITKETDVSQNTEELKKIRIKKRDILEMKQNGEVDEEENALWERERCLWNDIKNKSVTRLVTTVYAHTLVFLCLTVQVNLLGGRLLREEQEDEESKGGKSTVASRGDRYRVSHQTVLAKTYHYLFAQGIPSLAKSAGGAVDEILQKWDVLGDDVTLRDVSTWMESFRDELEKRHRKGVVSSLVKFIIPQEGGADDGNTIDATDELAKYILDETYDLLESPAFAKAERQCLDATFDQLRRNVFGKLFLPEDYVPLVTVVTNIQKTAVLTFHKPPSHEEEMKSWGGVLGMMEEPLPSVPNDYLSKLERLDAVVELSNVCF